MTPSEVAGLGGAALAGYAYVPQITHLVRERCSAGLSERAFALWLASSTLMTFHAIAIGAAVFMILGAQQILSTGLIAFLLPALPGPGVPLSRVSREPVARLTSREPADDVDHRGGRRTKIQGLDERVWTSERRRKGRTAMSTAVGALSRPTHR